MISDVDPKTLGVEHKSSEDFSEEGFLSDYVLNFYWLMEIQSDSRLYGRKTKKAFVQYPSTCGFVWLKIP